MENTCEVMDEVHCVPRQAGASRGLPSGLVVVKMRLSSVSASMVSAVCRCGTRGV
jgi:hypothetical protein